MTRKEHLLVILAEECGETAQRATKALRFGIEEVQKGQDLDNAERLIYEFNDLVAMMEMLKEEGLIPRVYDPEYVKKKKLKVEKYLKLSEQQGTLGFEKEMYQECFEKFIPVDKWDEATEFLSTYGNGLAKELAKNK